MNGKGKKTFAIAAVAILCAVALVGVGYAAFENFSSKTTSSKNPVSWGSLSVDDDKTTLNVNLMYGSNNTDGYTTYWLKDKDIAMKNESGVTVNSKTITLTNRTSSDITVNEETTNLKKIIAAKIGTLITPSAEKNAFPPSILNGMKFTFSATHGTEKFSVTVTLGEDGKIKTVTDPTGSITLKAKTSTSTDSCAFTITMDKTNWAPVLNSNPENYDDSYFSLTFEFEIDMK